MYVELPLVPLIAQVDLGELFRWRRMASFQREGHEGRDDARAEPHLLGR